jgi:hypothetical protein
LRHLPSKAGRRRLLRPTALAYASSTLLVCIRQIQIPRLPEVAAGRVGFRCRFGRKLCFDLNAVN